MKRVLVTPDIHQPYQDRRAENVVLKYASDHKWDEWIDLGDRLDFDFISKFNKDYPRLTQDKRFDTTYKLAASSLDEWLQALRAKNKNCKATWLEGNHEFRLQKHIDKYPELEGSLEVPVRMDLHSRGVNWVESWSKGDQYRVGKCTFIHGHWYNTHHAKKHVEAYMTNIVYGHTHDVQSFCLVNHRKNVPIEGLSLGCLSGPLDYMRGRPNNWSLAFGVFLFEDDGTFQRYVVRIINGQFRSPEGRLYK